MFYDDEHLSRSLFHKVNACCKFLIQRTHTAAARGGRLRAQAGLHLHRGKARLLPMEQGHTWYLSRLLARDNRNRLENYVAVICNCLPQYSEKIELSDDEFVEMLVADICFITEYLDRRGLGHHKGYGLPRQRYMGVISPAD